MIAIVGLAAIVAGALAFSTVTVDAPDAFDWMFEPAPTSIDCGSLVQPENPSAGLASGTFDNRSGPTATCSRRRSEKLTGPVTALAGRGSGRWSRCCWSRERWWSERGTGPAT